MADLEKKIRSLKLTVEYFATQITKHKRADFVGPWQMSLKELNELTLQAQKEWQIRDAMDGRR